MKDQIEPEIQMGANDGKFLDPMVTADGQERAFVALDRPKTLWFNTGTLCNITCENCYIDSSPTNDRLVYITAAEVETFLDQLEDRKWGVEEIGFTGGEPFMNPEMLEMARVCLERGYKVLILTNAMRPMQRPSIKRGLEALQQAHAGRLVLRISVDHWSAEFHDKERGRGSFEVTLTGMRFLRDTGIAMDIAGRTVWGESDAQSRDGYRNLFAENGFQIDADDPGRTLLFPEMDLDAPVPEITTACWSILGKSPAEVMCSNSRMVIKRKGADAPAVVACTLLVDDPQFEMGPDLAAAEKDVRLNHPHCAKFCVLGGASCSA